MSYDNIVRSIDKIHDEVHDSKCFDVSRFEPSLANNGTITFFFKTGVLPAHLSADFACGGNCIAEIYESPTVTVDGTAQTPRNLNRVTGYVSNASGWSVFLNPTVTVNGTELKRKLVPGGSGGVAQGGESRKGLEHIFEPTKTYIVRLTNIAGTAQPASLEIDWYEEALK